MIFINYTRLSNINKYSEYYVSKLQNKIIIFHKMWNKTVYEIKIPLYNT